MCEHKEIRIRITGKGEMHTFAKCWDCRKTLNVVDGSIEIVDKQKDAAKYLYKLFLPNK